MPATFDFVEDSPKSFDFQPETQFDFQPEEPKSPAVATSSLSPSAEFAKARLAHAALAGKAVADLPDKPLVTLPNWPQGEGSLEERITGKVYTSLKNALESVLSPKGAAITGAAIAAPEVVVPILGATAVKPTAQETLETGKSILKGDLPEAAGHATTALLNAGMVAGGYKVAKGLLPLSEAETRKAGETDATRIRENAQQVPPTGIEPQGGTAESRPDLELQTQVQPGGAAPPQEAPVAPEPSPAPETSAISAPEAKAPEPTPPTKVEAPAAKPAAETGKEMGGVELTPQQLLTAKRKIRSHYELKRPVTDEEAITEIANLRRKQVKGNLDDSQERLLASLQTGNNPIPEPKPPETPPTGPGMSPGPGAAARGEPGSYSAIEQLSDQLRTSPSPAKADKLSWRERLADKLTAGKSALAKVVGRMRAVSETVKEAATGMRKIDDVERTVSRLDRDLQTSQGNSANLKRIMPRMYKDSNMRRAAALYIDAGGDVEQFRQALPHLPANTPPEIRRAIETVANMPADARDLADFLQQYYGIREQDAVSADMFRQGLEDYYTHVWKDKPENQPDSLRHAVAAGKVNSYWQFARNRKISTFLEGIMEGKVPELDPAEVVPYYNFSLDRAIASRNFVKSGTEVMMDDGRPMFAATGTRQEVNSTEYAVKDPASARARRVYDTEAEAQADLQPGEVIEPRERQMVLIRPQAKNADIAGYRSVDHPAMRQWKWAETDENGKTTLYQGELQVHPDAYERIARIMERSRLNPSEVTRAYLGVSGQIKAAKFGLASTFHQVHLGMHAAFHWTNPFRVSNKPWVASDGTIDFSHPFVQNAIEKGHLKLAPEPWELNMMSEGILGGDALIHKLPLVGQWSKAYSEWLFTQYIPKLKLATYEAALPRNMRVLGRRGYSPEQIQARVGDAVNNAYGELNRLFLGKYGRDPRFQRFLQGSFIAPDFGEGRLRFVTKAMSKAGMEERLALATMFTTLYTTARVANWLSTGDPQWDWRRAFSVKSGNHWWSMRSVVGDLDHALSDFSQFMTVRLSPAVRTGLEFFTKRDSRGQKRTPSEQVGDFLRQFVPISAQGITSPDRKVWEDFLGAMGLSARREIPEQEVHILLNKWMEKSKDPKIKARYDRFQKETYAPSDYAPLRRALWEKDEVKARAEYAKLLSTRTPAQVKTAMKPERPFAGSAENERKFVASLDDKGREIYLQAMKDRRDQFLRFMALSR